jgi:DNA-3-methyladenine glycosylase I
MRYHDEEWGVPVHDSALLFEFLLLEGAQAGLSWLTILKRRDAYRQSFGAKQGGLICPETTARFNEKHIERLMANPGIIRNRRKIEAFIANSKVFLSMREAGVDFAMWLWDKVDGNPVINKHKTMKTIPVSTSLSVRISKELKAKGFSFVGPVSVYAFMQAVGMVNDHLVHCYRYRQLGGMP